MSKPSRKHHFVQAEHIRQFTNESGIVWVFGKDGAEFYGTPEGLFKKKDLNTIETPDGVDATFEAYVTEVENDCWPSLKRIIQNGEVSPADIPRITAYMALSRVRNPTVRTGILEFYRQNVDTTARLMDQRGSFHETEPWPLAPGHSITELLADGYLTIHINNTEYLKAVLQMIEPFQKILANGFSWCLVRSARDRVVISDHPLTCLHPGEHPGAYGIPPSGENCEIAFPLSKSLYLLGLWEREHGNIESEDAVDELNRRQAIFASRHIASYWKKRWVRSLASRYKGFGFQTLVDRVGPPEAHYQIMRAGVYQLPGTVIHRGEHPLKRTRAVVKRGRSQT